MADRFNVWGLPTNEVSHDQGKWVRHSDYAALEEENRDLRAALAFYARPEVYRPHPHGIGFENRDLSFVAVAALREGEAR